MPYDLKTLDAKLTGAKDWLQREYRSLRTGRASPAILDSVSVSAYGSMMPLKQLATIGTEDARTLRVQPFDAGTLKDIERAITAEDLGVGTASDGTIVRVMFPELSTERRAQLVKLAKGKLEEARTTARLAREETWKDIQEKERGGKVTEDDKFRLKDELQKKIDAVNEDMEKLFDAKEKEMSS